MNFEILGKRGEGDIIVNAEITSHSFDELKAEITSIFLESKGVSFQEFEVCWTDDNGNEHAICNDADYNKFIQSNTSNGQVQQPLRLTICTTDAAKPYAPEPAERIFVVHDGYTCDGCQITPIIGSRFKCQLCFDYELCRDCRRNDVHPMEHELKSMLRVDAATGCIVNLGVKCSSCNADPILGTYFKCLDCPGFYFCEACKMKAGHSEHDIERLPLFVTAAEVPVNTDRSCSECAKPIIGFRYECSDESCQDLNLCHACFSAKKHAQHALVRIPKGCDPLPVAINRNLVCAECLLKPIVGPYFKCLTCFDCVLCNNCTSRGIHGEHMVARMPTVSGSTKKPRDKEILVKSLYDGCLSMTKLVKAFPNENADKQPFVEVISDTMYEMLASQGTQMGKSSDSDRFSNLTEESKSLEDVSRNGRAQEGETLFETYPSRPLPLSSMSLSKVVVGSKVSLQNLIKYQRDRIDIQKKLGHSIERIIAKASAGTESKEDDLKKSNLLTGSEQNSSSLINHENIPDEKKLEITLRSQKNNNQKTEENKDWCILAEQSNPISLEKENPTIKKPTEGSSSSHHDSFSHSLAAEALISSHTSNDSNTDRKEPNEGDCDSFSHSLEADKIAITDSMDPHMAPKEPNEENCDSFSHSLVADKNAISDSIDPHMAPKEPNEGNRDSLTDSLATETLANDHISIDSETLIEIIKSYDGDINAIVRKLNEKTEDSK